MRPAGIVREGRRGVMWTASRNYVSIGPSGDDYAAPLDRHGSPQNSSHQGGTGMTNKFTVGINVAGTRHSVTVMAEDALVAALKVKLERPDAAINYVRRCNKRGDLRHPHDTVTTHAG
jgi:hypothetical protein